jgi:hypothetical protein
MRLFEIFDSEEYMSPGRINNAGKLKQNPFPGSKITQEMYHGSDSKGINNFRRPPEGVWFADHPEWCNELYSADGAGEVYACWINVKTPYMPTEEETDRYYGEMGIIGKFFTKLKKRGYDSYYQGGESGSLAVFDSVEIINAYTGARM